MILWRENTKHNEKIEAFTVSFKTIIIIIIIFIFMLTKVNGQPDLWPGSGPYPTLESTFKTIIITTFILILIRVNGQPSSWPEPSLRLTLKFSFKIMIITIFILTLTWVNSQLHHDLGLALSRLWNWVLKL